MMRLLRRDRARAVVATDIVGSTTALVQQGDRMWRETLETHNEMVRHHVRKHGGRVGSSTGDGFVLVFDEVTPALRCACIVSIEVERLRLSTRTGIDYGACRTGRGRCHGPAVVNAARVMALAGPGEVVATEAISAHAGSPRWQRRESEGQTGYAVDRREHTSRG